MTPIINRRFVSHQEATNYFHMLTSIVDADRVASEKDCPYYTQCNSPNCPLVANQYKQLEGEASCAFSS